MDIALIRQQLHECIEAADEQELLAIHAIIERQSNDSQAAIYNDATMNLLYQRRENHRNGLSKSYSADEAISIIRQRNQQ